MTTSNHNERAYVAADGRRMTTAKLKQAGAFRESNLKAARIIAADPERYPGRMQEWAARALAAGLRKGIREGRCMTTEPLLEKLCEKNRSDILRTPPPGCPACAKSRCHRPDEWRHHPAAGSGFHDAHGKPAEQEAKA